MGFYNCFWRLSCALGNRHDKSFNLKPFTKEAAALSLLDRRQKCVGVYANERIRMSR